MKLKSLIATAPYKVVELDGAEVVGGGQTFDSCVVRGLEEGEGDE